MEARRAIGEQGARGITSSCTDDPQRGSARGSAQPTLDVHKFQKTVSIDFFTVPTIRFQVLYVFLVLAHDRRRVVHFNVTAHPTAEWTGQQLREASRSKIRPDICCAIGMASSGLTSPGKFAIWASKKCSRRRVPPGKEPTSSA